MMETCPPINRSHEEDSKAFIFKGWKDCWSTHQKKTYIRLRKLYGNLTMPNQCIMKVNLVLFIGVTGDGSNQDIGLL